MVFLTGVLLSFTLMICIFCFLFFSLFFFFVFSVYCAWGFFGFLVSLETRCFYFSSQFFCFVFFLGGVIFFCIVHVYVFLFPRSEMVCARVIYRSDVLECGTYCVRLANFAYHANLHLHVIKSV